MKRILFSFAMAYYGAVRHQNIDPVDLHAQEDVDHIKGELNNQLLFHGVHLY
jgi:hypothetical protein